MPEEDRSHLTYIESLYPQKLVKSQAAGSWRVEAEDGLLPVEDLVPVSSSGPSMEPFNRPVGTRYKLLTFTPNIPTLHHSCMQQDLLTLKKMHQSQKGSHLVRFGHICWQKQLDD